MATGRETDAATAETEQPKAESAPAAPRKRGRPKGSKTRQRRRRRPAPRATSTAPATTRRSSPARQPAAPSARTRLTVEAIVAVDPPRDFRIHPRDRFVAYTGGRGRRAAAVRDAAPRRPADPS
jgi:hypothetical protein